MRWYWKLISKWRAWRYKRKYGISIEEGIREYGRYIILEEEKQ